MENATPVAPNLIVGVKDAFLVGAALASYAGLSHLSSFLGVMSAVAGPIAGLLTVVFSQLYTHHRSKVIAQATSPKETP